ncbi:MAG TPA: hypothetical protein VLA48_03175 [Nitrososphaeraceae archaeon]|nr:hypothetical protein [Nitrososphaeraceae archaeon]
MEWIRDRSYDYKLFKCSNTFEGDVYTVQIYVEEIEFKSVKFHVGLSSGKKRKHRDIFEEKEVKSKGGLRALFWVKRMIMEFPEWYGSKAPKQYICIQWADNRRRNIYSRLQRDGFMFIIDGGEKMLRKTIKK